MSIRICDPNRDVPLLQGAEVRMEGKRSRPLGRRRNAGSIPGRVGIFALFAALSLAVGVAPAAARYKVKYRVDHKESARNKEPFGDIPKGPLQIFISIDQQKLHLYSDGVHVADTSVATGVPSLPTPLGVFSVIQKQVFHRSNIYSGAPMPFMQRITWSGVAIHEGEGIGHRASHGCVRMPGDFAVRLYHLTKLGVPVYIARAELHPEDFADPHLFVHHDPVPPPVAATQVSVQTAATADPVTKTKVASVAASTASATDLGLRVSTKDGAATDHVSGAGKTDAGGDAAAQTAAPAAAATDPAAASPDSKPAPAPHAPAEAASDPKPDAAAAASDPPAAGAAESVPMPPVEPAVLLNSAPANKDPIAIFISRKEKKIYVRQDFAPLFQAPVTIADPDKPLGTHVFTALDFITDDHTALRWNVVTFPAERAPQPRRRVEREWRYDRYGRVIWRRVEAKETPAADLPAPATPAEALARIEIPQAAVDYISQLIGPGSSLIVSDHGLGGETGEGTNFIVVTR